MADIDIVPKKRSGSMWLWIVLAIVVVLMVWMMMARGSSPRTTGGLPGAGAIAVAFSPEVRPSVR
jgi:hypothetical protein